MTLPRLLFCALLIPILTAATWEGVTLTGVETTAVPAPIAAWPFDEGSGTTAIDVTGNGNDGTITNATYTGAGKFGDSLLFNSSSDRVTVPHAESFDLRNGMTVMAWVKPSSLTSFNTIWFKHVAYWAFASASTNVPTARIDDIVSRKTVDDDQALSTGTWQHVAVTYDGSTLRLFVDTNEEDSIAGDGEIVPSTGTFQIGNNTANEEFLGEIDEVRVYNVALSESQISQESERGLGSALIGSLACTDVQEGLTTVCTANVTGGIPSFTYSAAGCGGGGTASGNTNPFNCTGGSAGNYTATLTITDSDSPAQEIIVTDDFEIIAPTLDCPNGTTGGTITCTVSGGAPTFVSHGCDGGGDLANANGTDGSFDCENLSLGGPYTGTVTDGNSNVITDDFSVSAPSAGGIEARCTALGDNCMCNAPLANEGWTSLAVGQGSKDFMIPFNPDDTKRCEGHSLAPEYPPWFVPISRMIQLDHDDPDVGLPAAADTGEVPRVLFIDGNTGGNFQAVRVLSNYTAIDPMERVCTRYYFKWHPDTAKPPSGIYMTDGCNQKNHEMHTSGQDQRYVAPFHPRASGLKTLGIVRIGLPPPDTLWDGSTVHSNGWDSTASSGVPGEAYLAHCYDHWCRIEICADFQDVQSDWSNFAFEFYAEAVEDGVSVANRKKTQVTISDIGTISSTSSLSNFLLLNLYFPCLAAGGGGGCWPLTCSMGNGGRMYSHILLATWATASGQLIGAACEMEGGC